MYLILLLQSKPKGELRKLANFHSLEKKSQPENIIQGLKAFERADNRDNIFSLLFFLYSFDFKAGRKHLAQQRDGAE